MFRFMVCMRSCFLVACLVFCTVYLTVGQSTSSVATAHSATKSNVDSLPKTEPDGETVLVQTEDTGRPEPTGEAEEPATPEPISVGEPEQWPEPGPNWAIAFEEWGQAWPLHIYLFAVCYTIIALTGIRQVVQLYGTLKMTSLSLNVLLVVFGILRAVSLFIDPYMSTGVIPFQASRVLWSMSLPCLTSAFSFLLLVLLDTTKMTMGPPRFQKFSSIVSVTVIDFALVVITDTSVFLFPEAKPLLVVCQTLFITWGLLLAVGYTVAANKISKNICASSQSAHSKGNNLMHMFKKLIKYVLVILTKILS